MVRVMKRETALPVLGADLKLADVEVESKDRQVLSTSIAMSLAPAVVELADVIVR